MPWRAHEAEARSTARRSTTQRASAAAEAAFAQAKPREHNAFKIELGKRTLVRALHQAAALEIPT